MPTWKLEVSMSTTARNRRFTEIYATLTKSDGTLVARYGQVLINPEGAPGLEAPSEFPAWQLTSKQMALQQPTFTNADTTGLTLTITITPHGAGPIPIAHDTWTFTWHGSRVEPCSRDSRNRSSLLELG